MRLAIPLWLELPRTRLPLPSRSTQADVELLRSITGLIRASWLTTPLFVEQPAPNRTAARARPPQVRPSATNHHQDLESRKPARAGQDWAAPTQPFVFHRNNLLPCSFLSRKDRNEVSHSRTDDRTRPVGSGPVADPLAWEMPHRSEDLSPASGRADRRCATQSWTAPGPGGGRRCGSLWNPALKTRPGPFRWPMRLVVSGPGRCLQPRSRGRRCKPSIVARRVAWHGVFRQHCFVFPWPGGAALRLSQGSARPLS